MTYFEDSTQFLLFHQRLLQIDSDPRVYWLNFIATVCVKVVISVLISHVIAATSEGVKSTSDTVLKKLAVLISLRFKFNFATTLEQVVL